MATLSAFNDMMEQFLEELVQTFPNEPSMKKFQMSFEVLRKANARACMENYMDAIRPYASYVMAKDETFFLEHADTIKDLNLKTIWTPDLTEPTKEAIWKYLQTLYIIGNTVSALPQDTLDMIEQIAKKCAQDMSDGKLDATNLLAGMSSMFQGNNRMPK